MSRERIDASLLTAIPKEWQWAVTHRLHCYLFTLSHSREHIGAHGDAPKFADGSRIGEQTNGVFQGKALWPVTGMPTELAQGKTKEP